MVASATAYSYPGSVYGILPASVACKFVESTGPILDVFNGPVRVYRGFIVNKNAAAVSLKLRDSLSYIGGTDAPDIIIPVRAAFSMPFFLGEVDDKSKDQGISFANGLSVSVTTGASETDNTAIASATNVIVTFWREDTA